MFKQNNNDLTSGYPSEGGEGNDGSSVESMLRLFRVQVRWYGTGCPGTGGKPFLSLSVMAAGAAGTDVMMPEVKAELKVLTWNIKFFGSGKKDVATLAATAVEAAPHVLLVQEAYNVKKKDVQMFISLLLASPQKYKHIKGGGRFTARSVRKGLVVCTVLA